MKKYILTISILLISFFSFAQVFVEGVNINELEDVKYCQLINAGSYLLETNIIITIDYGQKRKRFDTQKIEDKNKKTKKFNSIIDALNFMDKNGWEYLNSYPITDSSGTSDYIYLLKKRISAK